MKKVCILGSTGSIGCSTLNVIRNNKNLFKVEVLIAGENVYKLIEQIIEFKPKYVYIKSKKNAKLIKERFKNLVVYYGVRGIEDITKLKDFDIAVSALVGISGLKPTYNIIQNGKVILLANKEVLVSGGKLIMDAVKKYGAKLIPIDSEHSAIMQCLNGEENNKIDKILITASGGPFLKREITDDITPEAALKHPTWNMGKKVTIDSATMMNKGFEVIEAKWLFDVNRDQIEVLVHEKSLVHSMVEFVDGTIIANIAPKSMEIPISYALNYPKRLSNDFSKLNLFDIKTLEFNKVDYEKFKCLKIALDTLDKGQSYQVVLNAADEILVNAFLNEKIKFTDIPLILERVINNHKEENLDTIENILKLDKKIKKITKSIINKMED